MILKSSKKKVTVFNENDIFYEEVDAEELKKQKYKEEKKSVLFLRLFLLFSALLLGFCVYYAFIKDKGKVEVITYDSGDLYLVHSKANFGDTITSFISSRTEETAVVYKFYVENVHDVNIGYSLRLINENIIGKSNVSEEVLRYSLYKNSKKMATGVVSGLKQNVLITTKIEKNSKDNYILKLWLPSEENGVYNYRIDMLE